MLTAIRTFLTPYKFYIAAVAVALLVSGWLFDRHAQYNKGKAECEMKVMQATADFWESKSETLRAEAKAAIKREKVVTETISSRLNKRQAEVDKSVELSKANPSGGCVLSDDELLDTQQAIRAANSQ